MLTILVLYSFQYQIIDLGGEPTTGDEYFNTGKVTEFKYCNHIAEAMRGYYPLVNLRTIGEPWGMYPNTQALGKQANRS